MYHNLITQHTNAKLRQLADNSTIHTGYYGFYYLGGWITGKVIRVGLSDLSVATLTLGIVTMSIDDFLDSSPSKL
jgi:hypothetical protein